MANSYDLHGKYALVTGGAKGIGRAVAELLIASGANVRVWDADPAQVSGASSDIVDITDRAAIEAALARMPRADQPDILINDAGYLGQTRSFLTHASEDWQKIVEVNLVGTMRVTQAVLRRAHDLFGSTVNIAARIAALASPGELLATQPVAGVATASGIAAHAIGAVTLRSITDPVVLYSIELAPALDPAWIDPVCKMHRPLCRVSEGCADGTLVLFGTLCRRLSAVTRGIPRWFEGLGQCAEPMRLCSAKTRFRSN